MDLSWRFHRSHDTEWTASGGISAANAQNMRSYFGIDAAGSLASGKPAYEPGAGLRSTYAGVGFTHRLAPHWLAFGSTGVSRLLGLAAASPLTERRDAAFADDGDRLAELESEGCRCCDCPSGAASVASGASR